MMMRFFRGVMLWSFVFFAFPTGAWAFSLNFDSQIASDPCITGVSGTGSFACAIDIAGTYIVGGEAVVIIDNPLSTGDARIEVSRSGSSDTIALLDALIYNYAVTDIELSYSNFFQDTFDGNYLAIHSSGGFIQERTGLPFNTITAQATASYNFCDLGAGSCPTTMDFAPPLTDGKNNLQSFDLIATLTDNEDLGFPGLLDEERPALGGTIHLSGMGLGDVALVNQVIVGGVGGPPIEGECTDDALNDLRCIDTNDNGMDDALISGAILDLQAELMEDELIDVPNPLDPGPTVPVPSAGLLFGSALGLLWGVRRFSSSSRSKRD